MSVYSCWYQNCFGYACQLDSGKWMFVPEMGQADRHIYRGLKLSELQFSAVEEAIFEYGREENRSLLQWFRALLTSRYKPQSIAGRLLLRY